MQTVMGRQLGVLLLLCCASVALVADAVQLPQLNFYHRFSDEVMERIGGQFPAPKRFTSDYHKLLVNHDLTRHGRKLATAGGGLITFSDGNFTIYFAGIQYAFVEVGTPPTPFFVALDSGSNLFWLPCQCQSCGTPPANSQIPSGPYDPSNSSTSQIVTCGSTTCSSEFSTCSVNGAGSTGQCDYTVAYGDGNTTTSGTVYEDVLRFVPESTAGAAISPSVVVGCGQIQTGDLLQSVFDGLMGLGRSSYTVPSILVSSGVVGNSFSMCFDVDGSGRIVFGDSGGANVSTTPMQPSPTSLRYLALADSFTIGASPGKTVTFGQTMIVDTGTSYSYLPTAVYKAFLNDFASLTTYNQTTFDGVFDLCYSTSNPALPAPPVTINLSGGVSLEIFGLLVPYYNSVTNVLVGFCVGVLDGDTDSIFAANFMYGYNVVFNSEQQVFGFEQTDCYHISPLAISPGVEGPSPSPSSSSSPSPSPSPTLGPSPAKSPSTSPAKSPTAPTSSSGGPTPFAGGPTPSSGGTPTGSGPAPPPNSAPGLHVSILSLIVSSLLATFVFSNLGF